MDGMPIVKDNNPGVQVMEDYVPKEGEYPKDYTFCEQRVNPKTGFLSHKGAFLQASEELPVYNFNTFSNCILYRRKRAIELMGGNENEDQWYSYRPTSEYLIDLDRGTKKDILGYPQDKSWYLTPNMEMSKEDIKDVKNKDEKPISFIPKEILEGSNKDGISIVRGNNG
jgi:hypothetical protein